MKNISKRKKQRIATRKHREIINDYLIDTYNKKLPQSCPAKMRGTV